MITKKSVLTLVVVALLALGAVVPLLASDDHADICYTRSSIEQNFAYILENPQPGDVITLPVCTLFCCVDKHLALAYPSVVFAPTNFNNIEKILFTSLDDGELPQVFNSLEDLELAIDNLEYGTITIFYYLPEDLYDQLDDVLSIQPRTCMGGWIPFQSRLESEDFFFVPGRGWVCQGHRVRVWYHCPCGRATQNGIRLFPGCGRLMG